MSVFALGILVAITGQAGTTTPVHGMTPRTVFLLEGTRGDGNKSCAQAAADALRTAIGKAPRSALAKSAREADVIVKVVKCATDTTSASARELELSGSAGSRRGGGARLNSATEIITEARVTLAADWDGTTREFTSGPAMLPIRDAARLAMERLVGWVESVPDDATP